MPTRTRRATERRRRTDPRQHLGKVIPWLVKLQPSVVPVPARVGAKPVVLSLTFSPAKSDIAAIVRDWGIEVLRSTCTGMVYQDLSLVEVCIVIDESDEHAGAQHAATFAATMCNQYAEYLIDSGRWRDLRECPEFRRAPSCRGFFLRSDARTKFCSPSCRRARELRERRDQRA
jgi:hypothetical protein